MSLSETGEPGIFFFTARAFGLRGLVALHSWVIYHSELGWVVLEVTNRANLKRIGADLIYCPTHSSHEYVPTISMNRSPNKTWFGIHVIQWGKITPDDQESVVAQLWRATVEYPFRDDYQWLVRNCNTFASWLIYRVDESIKPPLRCIGARSKRFWRQKEINLLP